jgi:hypothetical protein
VYDDFGGLFLSEFIIHRPVEVVGDLRDPSRRDQRGHGDEAATAGREIGTQPQISEQVFGRVLDEARRHEPELIAHVLRALRLGRFIQRQRRRLGIHHVIEVSIPIDPRSPRRHLRNDPD